ncbi:type VI secretion system contractile sheath small subunit, partial [Pseudomonas syringae]|uniref:type VI secretion system contractile sheath small subunit n=2 Tax=Pseudomonas syringae TaxID=317 RepID=UPI000B1DA837
PRNAKQGRQVEKNRLGNEDGANGLIVQRLLKGIKPRLAYRVDNTLAKNGTQLGVELNFNALEDFEPQNVVRQVEPLRKLLEVRNKLADLRNKMGGNDKLEELLMDVLQNTEKLKTLGKEFGREAAVPATDSKE